MFINLGKAGGSAMADAEAMGRLISLALRSGIPLMEIHRQLRGISSDRAVGLGPNKVLSVPDAIGIALEEWWREKQGVQQDLLMATGEMPVIPTPAGQRTTAPIQMAGVQAADGSREHTPAQQRSSWRVPGLWFAAGVRGRLCEVPRVRVLGVRMN